MSSCGLCTCRHGCNVLTLMYVNHVCMFVPSPSSSPSTTSSSLPHHNFRSNKLYALFHHWRLFRICYPLAFHDLSLLLTNTHSPIFPLFFSPPPLKVVYLFFCFLGYSYCSCLNENDPCWHWYLNSWSSFGGTVREGLGGVVCWRRDVTWGGL